MQKLLLVIMLILSLATFNNPADAKTKNDADTDLNRTLKLALLNSLDEPVNKAINEIYEDDKDIPGKLTWNPYDAEILEINQIYGKGGLYGVTLKIYPYYRAHNSYGEDKVTVNTSGELVNFRHLKTYH